MSGSLTTAPFTVTFPRKTALRALFFVSLTSSATRSTSAKVKILGMSWTGTRAAYSTTTCQGSVSTKLDGVPIACSTCPEMPWLNTTHGDPPVVDDPVATETAFDGGAVHSLDDLPM